MFPCRSLSFNFGDFRFFPFSKDHYTSHQAGHKDMQGVDVFRSIPNTMVNVPTAFNSVSKYKLNGENDSDRECLFL